MKVEWLTFDCYGTLIDWEADISEALAPLLPSSINRNELTKRYIGLEAEIEKEQYRPYREVLAIAASRLMNELGHPLAPGKENVLVDSLPDWRAFPEVPETLRSLRAAGYRLAILSNIDRDLLASSVKKLGMVPDLLVTAQDCDSYKPSHGHWRHFQGLTGAGPSSTVHVAASLFHDIAPAGELGYRTVFINRKQETATRAIPTRELPDLTRLPLIVDELSH
jgi:2-haloacid dehalogenase